MARQNVNKLTPGRNMIWEASRMMLPEHKEEIVRHRETLGRKERPELDEQEAEELARRIGEAMETGRPIALTLYGELGSREERGVVAKLDPQRGRVRLRTDEGDVWIAFRDIIGADEPREAD